MDNLDLVWIGTTLVAIANLALVWWNVRRAGSYSLRVSQISRDIKISEFRQAWINALRDDISAYIGAADMYHRKDIELIHVKADLIQPAKTTDQYLQQLQKSEEALSKEADEWRNKAEVLYWRIMMRINPREDNPFKIEDRELLECLHTLLSPA